MVAKAGKPGVRPVEFRYHGSVATSSTSLLRELEIHDQGLRPAVTAASVAAEKSKLWLRLKRKGTSLCANDGNLSCVSDGRYSSGQTTLHAHYIIVLTC